MRPPVTIVILNWNGWRDTLECLKSLEALDYPNYHTIVVDNASSDDSVTHLLEAYPELTLLRSGRNLGFAGGNNLGIRRALEDGAAYVWLLNNDTVVTPGALDALVRRLEEKPGAGMCGSSLRDYHRPNRLQTLGGARFNKWLGLSYHIGQDVLVDAPVDPLQVESKLDYIVGASMLVSRALLTEVGLMSEDYFLYYEEVDWAVRAQGRYSLAFAPGSVVYHKEGASAGSSSSRPQEKSRLSDYHGIRSRLLFTRKFYPYALPTVYLGLALSIINRLRRRQWDRVWMIVKLGLGVER